MSHSASPERRQDILTRREVIVAANRSDRPIHVAKPAMRPTDLYDPFLEGNESDTPQESLALRRAGSQPNQPGWLLRVVPNRYPAVTRAAIDSTESSARGAARPAIGIHEVVIECPDRRTRLADLSVVEVARILTAWQLRHNTLVQLSGIKAINIFRNEGAMAGASLPHCHSQIVASHFQNQAAGLRADIEEKLQEHFGGSSLYQKWLERELKDDVRIVNADDSLVICCPFASRVAWQVRFGPRLTDEQLASGFGNLTEGELIKLAARLLSVVKTLRDIHGEVAFNLVLYVPPVDLATQSSWMLDLMPRTSHFAGFELLTDIDIITTAPEEAARRFRANVEWTDIPQTSDFLCPAGYDWL